MSQEEPSLVNDKSLKLPSSKSDHEQAHPILQGELMKKQEKAQLSTYEKFVDNMFLYSKMKGQMSKEQIQKVIEMFGLLTSGKKQQRQFLSQLKKNDQRDKLIIIDVLKDESQQIRSQSKYYFSLVIEQLCQRITYLNAKGAIKLINIYLNLNQSIYITNGKFNWQYIVKECNIISKGMHQVKKQIFFIKMVSQIIQIVNIIYKQYNIIFDMIKFQKKGNVNMFIQKIKKQYMYLFTQKIWKSFLNIINVQKLNKSKIYHTNQINILLKGLNLCLDLQSNYFKLNNFSSQILPHLVHNMKLIEISTKIDFMLIQRFIITLAFANYDQQNHRYQGNIGALINDQNMRRFKYLTVFERHNINKGEFLVLQPLKSDSTLMVLQKLIEWLPNKYITGQKVHDRIGGEKNKFILQSICNIIKYNPQRFWLQKQTNYKNIVHYILEIQKQVVKQIQKPFHYDYKDEYEEIEIFTSTNKNYYINFIRYSKLMNVICYPRPKIIINATQFNSLMKHKNVIQISLTNLHHIVNLKKMLKDDLILSLRQNNLCIGEAYQFFHKLIIANSNILLQQKNNIQSAFSSFDNFIREIIINYLRQYSQDSQNQNLCIFAINQLIYNEKYHNVAIILMKQLSHLDYSKIKVYNREDNIQNFNIYTELQYIIQRIFKNRNNLMSISYQVLICCKFNQDLLKNQWFKWIFQYLLELPETYHPEDLYQYAQILTICLKEIPQNHNIIRHLPNYFNFNFIRTYLNQVLSVSYENGVLINKLMQGCCYNKIMIGVKLMKELTQLIIYQKQIGSTNFLPAQIRSFFNHSQKTKKTSLTYNKIMVNYSSSLIVLLLSKSFNNDPIIQSQFPLMKSMIFEILININKINPGQYLQSNVITYNNFNSSIIKQQRIQFNLNKLLQNHILQHPTNMGLQYLLISGRHHFSMKKTIFQKSSQIKNEKGLPYIKLKSHFMLVYWRQMQTTNPEANLHKAWQFIVHEMIEIMDQLQQWIIEQQLKEDSFCGNNQHINKILHNIYDLSLLLFNKNKSYYVKYMSKYYKLFLNPSLNKTYIISERLSSLSQIYIKSILSFFNCKSTLSQSFFQKLHSKELERLLYVFLIKIIQFTYQKQYKIKHDVIIFDILQFGIAFMMDLMNHNADNYLIWLRELIEKIEDRPQRNIVLSSTKQIIIILLIKNEIKGKIRSSSLQNQTNLIFSNDNWNILLPLVSQDIKTAHFLLTELANIYEKHPIYFINSCNYLLQLSKTNHIQSLQIIQSNNKHIHIIDLLSNILTKAINDKKSYHIIWIIEILIQIINNQYVYSLEMSKKIFQVVLNNKVVNDRITELIYKFGGYFADNLKDLWLLNGIKLTIANNKITFAEKSQLLSYLRFFSLSYFNFKNYHSIHCKNSVQSTFYSKLVASISSLIPILVETLISRNQPYQINQQWQCWLIKFDIKLLGYQIRQGIMKQFDKSQLDVVLKNKNGMNLVDEIMNIELMSIITLWFPILSQPERFTSLYLKKESLPKIDILLTLFLQLKNKILYYSLNQHCLKHIFFNFNTKIYNSTYISRQLHFINLSKLSTNLKLDYQSIKQRLNDGFIYVGKLLRQILKHYIQSLYKIDNNFIQRYNKIVSEVKSKIVIEQVHDYNCQSLMINCNRRYRN